MTKTWSDIDLLALYKEEISVDEPDIKLISCSKERSLKHFKN